jgi:predicted aspartyl protease
MNLYSDDFLPPAPTLTIEVRNAQSGAATTVLAKIDSGADGSVIPVRLVEELGLIPFDTLLSMAFDGSVEKQISYLVDFTFADKQFHDLEVITAPLDYVLIGRDVLNHIVTILNGPDQQLYIR